MKKVELPDLKLGFVVRSDQGAYTTRDFYLFPLKTQHQQPAGACLFEVLKANHHQDTPLCSICHGYITERRLRAVLFYRNNPGEEICTVPVTPNIPENLSYRGLVDIQKQVMSPTERQAYDKKTVVKTVNNILLTTPDHQKVGEVPLTASPVWHMTLTCDASIPTEGKWRILGFRRLKHRSQER